MTGKYPPGACLLSQRNLIPESRSIPRNPKHQSETNPKFEILMTETLPPRDTGGAWFMRRRCQAPEYALTGTLRTRAFALLPPSAITVREILWNPSREFGIADLALYI
jgi:hypothetical protein